jgi:hypothetical protein
LIRAESSLWSFSLLILPLVVHIWMNWASSLLFKAALFERFVTFWYKCKRLDILDGRISMSSKVEGNLRVSMIRM